MMTRLRVDYLTLLTEEALHQSDASSARGYVGTRFSDEILLHHHNGDQLLYTYPKVQFKVLNGRLTIVGIEEGAEVLEELQELHEMDLHGKMIPVVGFDLSSRVIDVGPTADSIRYRFVTPWMALNQKNSPEYLGSSREGKRLLLAKIVVGNVLSMCKGLDVVVDRELTACFQDLRESRVSLKGTPMTGLISSFFLNFRIPPLLGLGKAVSRGFGTLIFDGDEDETWNCLSRLPGQW